MKNIIKIGNNLRRIPNLNRYIHTEHTSKVVFKSSSEHNHKFKQQMLDNICSSATKKYLEIDRQMKMEQLKKYSSFVRKNDFII